MPVQQPPSNAHAAADAIRTIILWVYNAARAASLREALWKAQRNWGNVGGALATPAELRIRMPEKECTYLFQLVGGSV